ncbi:MAG: tRNA (adenosine(37)-N6)-dimethylallyltransferase MiaA [Gemmatimonadales bacterium]
MAEARPLVPVIVGPTAVGKTALAMELNDYLPVAVISADSRQIYRGLDIGTATPTTEEMARVPHYGIDVVAPGDVYSAGRFCTDAVRWLADAAAGGRKPVVVGGTGLYVRALTEGIFQEPLIDADKKSRLRSWTARHPDPVGLAARLDPGFTRDGGIRRAGRAIEVALLTGRPLSWWQQNAAGSPAVVPWYIRMSLSRERLHERIACRVSDMLEAGLVQEVRRLIDAGIPPDARGLDGVGYRECVAYLNGDVEEDDLLQRIVVGTRRYAKRQETWFRNQLTGDVSVVDASRTPAELAAEIARQWRERRNS